MERFRIIGPRHNQLLVRSGRARFVGVCRAETYLTLTRYRQYRENAKRLSIFLEEMGIDPYSE